jgi:hypothetical protein
MKTIISALAFSFCGHFCFAETVSLICDGVTQTIPSQVQSGKIEILVAGEESLDSHHFDGAYLYSVNWQDASLPALRGDGVNCGVAISGAPCSLEKSGPNFPFSVYEACGVGAFDTRGLPHQKFSSRLTLSDDHGFFYCAAHDAVPAVYKHIELSHCQAK